MLLMKVFIQPAVKKNYAKKLKIIKSTKRFALIKIFPDSWDELLK